MAYNYSYQANTDYNASSSTGKLTYVTGLGGAGSEWVSTYTYAQFVSQGVVPVTGAVSGGTDDIMMAGITSGVSVAFSVSGAAATSGWKFVGGIAKDQVTGGSGNDSIDGGSGNDVLDGGAGNDTLIGGAGDDTLVGNTGNDNLWGGIGNDSLEGGAGSDTYRFGRGDGADRLIVSAGTATGDIVNLNDINFASLSFLSGATADVHVVASDSSLYIDNSAALASALTYRTLDGVNFKLAEGNAATVFTYEAGMRYVGVGSDDVITAASSTAGVNIHLGSTDYQTNYFKGMRGIIGSGFNDLLRGSEYADTINGGTGADSIWGGAGGNDILEGGAGADQYWFGRGDGADKLVVSGGTATGDIVNLNDINFASLSFLSGATADVHVVASDSSLYIDNSAALAAALTYRTQDGVTFKLAEGNVATVFTYATGMHYVGVGSDDFITAASSTVGVNIHLGSTDYQTNYFNGMRGITGSGFNDLLRGSAGADTISGADGADSIWGGTGGDDSLVGGAGADQYWFGATEGSDTIDAGTATEAAGDLVHLSDINFGEITFVTDGIVQVDSVNKLTVDNISLGIADALTYVTKDNVTFKHTLNAAGTYTYVSGTSFVGYGNGNVYGISASNASAGVNIHLGQTSYQTNYFSNFTAITGSGFNDLLRGSESNDTISGGVGADSLWGGTAGDDSLVGGAGADGYWYGATDGNDIISATAADAVGDVVHFSDLRFSDLTFSTNGVVSIDAANTLTVSGYTASVAQAITYQTNDGVTFKLASTAATTFDYDSSYKYVGITGSDILSGERSSVAVDIQLKDQQGITTAVGSRFNDILRGTTGNDSLVGGAGDDNLWGYSGGNDTMTGGSGADVFWFGKNDGNDEITDGSSVDSVMLSTEGLTVADVTTSLFGGNLTLTVEGGNLQIDNWSTSGLNTFKIGTTNYKYDSATNALVVK